MHYIITDIHNDSWRFMKLLEKWISKRTTTCICLVICLTAAWIIQTRRACIFRYWSWGKMYCDPRQPRSLACQLHFPLLRDGWERPRPPAAVSVQFLPSFTGTPDGSWFKAARRAHPFLAGTGGNRGRWSAVSACPCLYGRTGKMETGQLLSDGGFVVQGFSSWGSAWIYFRLRPSEYGNGSIMKIKRKRQRHLFFRDV